MALISEQLSYSIKSQWSTGYTAEVALRPTETTYGWRVDVSFDGNIASVANARVVSHVGNTYTLENLVSNGTIAAGQTLKFSIRASGSDTTIDLAARSVAPPPALILTNETSGEGDPLAPVPAHEASLMGPLHTSGNQILNAAGEAVAIEAVNWFGLETVRRAPDGLQIRNYMDMMDQMKELGFNAIRMPFSLDAVLKGADSIPTAINATLNPDLAGLSSLEVLDKIVAYAEEIDLGIILDSHRSGAGDGPNFNGLWYSHGYTEADWIAGWQALATRYGTSEAIIGADLANEPHATLWDPWATAAEKAGNAILEITNDWLVIVEGVEKYGKELYWWGGNLKGVADRPVVLSASDKLVYSAHDYPASIYNQNWFKDESKLTDVFREHWGFIHEQNIAPVLIGELGSKLESAADKVWANAITDYLSGDYDGNGAIDPGGEQINFAWWSWTHNSYNTGGVLTNDWRTPREGVLDLLDGFLSKPSSSGSEGNILTFDVALAEAATSKLTLTYKTTDGTATAGSDYVGRVGAVTFAPGEQTKTVVVKLLGDTTYEGSESFFLDFAGVNGPGRAVGTIVNDDPLPLLSISDVTVDEFTGKAVVTATLSEASAIDASVGIMTGNGRAIAGSDYVAKSSTLSFAAGATTATFEVDLINDKVAEASEWFRVLLADAENATIADNLGYVTITDGDDLVASAKLKSRWSSGTQVTVTLKNTGADAINDWGLTFDAPAAITKLWNGSLTGNSGEVAVDALASNSHIAAGKSVTFGFQVNNGTFDLAAWQASADFDVFTT